MSINLSELVGQINQETTMDENWSNPEYLSDLLLKLASYYATLGQFVADAERDHSLAEMHLKVTKALVIKAKLEDGESAKSAELTANGHDDLNTVQQDLIALQHKARLLFLTRQSLEKTLDAIRSKLSYLNKEKESSRHAV